MLQKQNAIVVALAVSVISCDRGGLENLPPVAGRVDQTEAQFEWGWCEASIPVLHNCGEFGSVSDIGKAISESHVCSLVVKMQEWQSQRGWTDVENVRVCRTSRWIEPPEPGRPIGLDHPKLFTTFLQGDFPEHNLSLWVVLHEESGEITIHTDAL